MYGWWGKFGDPPHQPHGEYIPMNLNIYILVVDNFYLVLLLDAKEHEFLVSYPSIIPSASNPSTPHNPNNVSNRLAHARFIYNIYVIYVFNVLVTQHG